MYLMHLSFKEREAMDAAYYSMAGFPVVGLFIVLMGVVFSFTLSAYATVQSKDESKKYYSKDVFELAAGLLTVGAATGGTLLMTYDFMWTTLALVVSGVIVTAVVYRLDKRELSILD